LIDCLVITSVLLIERLIKMSVWEIIWDPYHGGAGRFLGVWFAGGICERRVAGCLRRLGPQGDFDGSTGPGLFYPDTRYLSRFVLRVDGEAPVPLEARTWGSEAEFVLSAGGGEYARRATAGARGRYGRGDLAHKRCLGGGRG
jgi:hypothetical protein